MTFPRILAALAAAFLGLVPVGAGAQTISGGGTSLTNIGQNVTFSPDNTYDVGATAANRPRNLFVAGSATIAGSTTVGDAQKFVFGARSRLNSPVDGAVATTTSGGVLPTVSGLGSASTAGAGAQAVVSDATACATKGATVAGGGSTVCPVYSDGTNWKIT